MVFNASGCTNNDMGAVFQGADLGAYRLAATDGEHFDVVLVACQSAHLLSNLGTKLPCGTEDKALYSKLAWLYFVQQADAKGGCFAAAGFGFGD